MLTTKGNRQNSWGFLFSLRRVIIKIYLYLMILLWNWISYNCFLTTQTCSHHTLILITAPTKPEDVKVGVASQSKDADMITLSIAVCVLFMQSSAKSFNNSRMEPLLDCIKFLLRGLYHVHFLSCWLSQLFLRMHLLTFSVVLYIYGQWSKNLMPTCK